MGGGVTDDMCQVTRVESVIMYKYRVQVVVDNWGSKVNKQP